VAIDLPLDEEPAAAAPVPVEIAPGVLPDLVLPAAVSGREVALRAAGIPAVLVVHGQSSAGSAVAVNLAVRSRYPGAAEVLVASVVDLHTVPRMFRKVADRALARAYEQAAGTVPGGLSPEDYVVILPDWDGAVAAALDLGNVGEEAAVLVVDRSGAVAAVIRGGDPGSAACAALEALPP